MYELQTRLGVIVNTLMELTCSGVRVVFFSRVATKVGTWPSYSNICFSSISRFRFFTCCKHGWGVTGILNTLTPLIRNFVGLFF